MVTPYIPPALPARSPALDVVPLNSAPADDVGPPSFRLTYLDHR